MKEHDMNIAPYDECLLPVWARVLIGAAAYIAAVGALMLFYRLLPLALIVGLAAFPVAVSVSVKSSVKNRSRKLLGQFQSLLESLAVSLQSGSTDLNAFKHALADMEMMYSPKSDISKETRLLIAKFDRGISIGEALTDFAERSKLEDVKLFAAVYLSVEGRGDKSRDIVIRTQKVLSDKISIQSEIQTLSAGAVMEINIMVVIPIFIVGVMGFMGGEMMEGLFTPMGRVVSTIAIFIFAGAYFMGKKITNIKV